MINFKKIFKMFFVTIPLLIGVVGYLNVPGIKLSSALYNSIRLYGLNTDTNEINILIEIARWTAPIFTMSVILYYIKDSWYRLVYSLRAFKKNSCSVYGDNSDATYFLDSLGNEGIKGNIAKPNKSKYHVFFINSIKDVIEIINNSSIQLMMEKNSKDYQFIFQVPWDTNISFKRSNIHTFSIEENCSIKYWEENLAIKNEKIAIIGNKIFCEAILDKGLQFNILSENQNIEYHIWSDIHYNKTKLYLDKALNMTGDKVCVYIDAWESHLPLLGTMDRIIVIYENTDNISIGIKLLNTLINPKIHVYSNYDVDVNTLFNSNRITCFGIMEDIINRDVIIRESLRETAKKIHQHYISQYSTIPQWTELSSFFVKSNMSTAAYFQVIEKLYRDGISKGDLNKLEHIRWCRFHYLQNWKYGTKKDFNQKTHPCLVSFEKLSIEEKKKDMENVDLALKFAELIK